MKNRHNKIKGRRTKHKKQRQKTKLARKKKKIIKELCSQNNFEIWWSHNSVEIKLEQNQAICKIRVLRNLWRNALCNKQIAWQVKKKWEINLPVGTEALIPGDVRVGETSIVLVWPLTVLAWSVTVLLWPLTILVWPATILVWTATVLVWPLIVLVWPLTVLVWPVTVLLWPVTALVWTVTVLVWPLTVLVWPVTTLVWTVTALVWPVIILVWPVTVLVWPMTTLVWPVTTQVWTVTDLVGLTKEVLWLLTDREEASGPVSCRLKLWETGRETGDEGCLAETTTEPWEETRLDEIWPELPLTGVNREVGVTVAVIDEWTGNRRAEKN